MAETFNPYYTFLGLDEELTSPSYYQLLRLKEQESDPEKIQAAAAKAATRVRGHRPGEHAAQWAKLLDEVQAAKDCLLDPNQRQAYDQRLGFQSTTAVSSAPPSSPANPASFASPAMTFIATPQQDFAYPPGVGPANSSPAAYTQPGYGPGSMPPTDVDGFKLPPTSNPGYEHPGSMPPAGWNRSPTADPMAPMPGMPGPMAPVAYTWTTMPPMGPAVAPPVAPVQSNSFDPMAPFAFPAGSQPPADSRPRIVGFAGGAPTIGSSSSIPFATPASVAVPLGTAVVPVAQVAEASRASVLGLPTTAESARPIAKRPAKFPLPLVLGVGGGVLLLAGLLIAWGMSGGGRPETDPLAENHQGQPVGPVDPVPQPAPEPRPMPVSPEPEPEPEMTDPIPAPEPQPEKPTPVPEPIKPESKPEPTPKPTAAELAELSRLMKEAKVALGDFTFDEAEAALEQAAEVAKTPEHQAVVSRLKTVADMAKQFRLAIVKSMTQLDAGEEIKIGTGNVMIVVESSPEKLILRRNGKNEPYTLSDMPLGLAVYLGERVLNADDANTRLLKGSYVFVDKRTDPAQLAKARTWWEEAQLNGVDITDLLPVLSDMYDFAAEPSPE